MPKDTLLDPPQVSQSGIEEARAAAAFVTHLVQENGYSDPRLLGDGRYACVMPLLFTSAIITGRIGDFVGYEDRWCYGSLEAARAALETWSGIGEPEGWHRHPMTGRRRQMTDDGLEEWINP